jgi:hypothetical protein
LRKKKGEEFTKDGIGPLSSTETRHPLSFGGTTMGGGGLGPPLPPVGPRQGVLRDFFLQRDCDSRALRWDCDRGGWNLLFLRQDFFPQWDCDSGALRDWDLLFLRQDRNSFGL